MNSLNLESDSTGTILTLSLNKPESLNALDDEMIDELSQVLANLSTNRETRAIVLTGVGRGFCSGLNLASFGGSLAKDDSRGRVQAGMYFQKRLAEIVLAMRRLPIPIVGAINGPATGGGLALALACDTRVCSIKARFSAAFVKLGVSGCDMGVSYLLPRIVGPTLAFEMMLTGRIIDAAEAERSRLVLRCTSQDDLLGEANGVATQIASNSPFGVWMTKEVLWSNLDATSLSGAIDLENRTQILALQTSDSKEAASAFIHKRPAEYKNT